MMTTIYCLVLARYVVGAVYLQAPVVLLYGVPPLPLCGGVGRPHSHLRPPERGPTPGWEVALVPATSAGLGLAGVGVVLVILLRTHSL